MYCECGCGLVTPIAKKTRTHLGHVKGRHVRYVNGHSCHQEYGPLWSEEDRGYDTPCRIRKGHRSPRGYTRENCRQGHALAWERQHGPIPAGLVPDHLCRQRDCIRVSHLELVTSAENSRRGLVAKLSKDDVRAIRASTEPRRVLAERYDVSVTNISMIRCGRSWKDVA